VDEALRLEAFAALDVLERELGPDWPREALFDDDGLGAFLGNAAGWPARQVVLIAREFELFNNDAAWPGIVHKLRKPKSGDSRSSLFQLHVAALARQRGLHAALEPPAGTGKMLDVVVRESDANDGREYFIECTENQPIPDVAQTASDQSLRLWPLDLLERNLQARVDVEPGLTPSETADVAERLARAYDAVAATGVPQEISAEGSFRAWIAPVGHPETARLITTYGDPGLFVPFEHDPLHRLLATVKKKLRQTRQDAANVIALRPSRLLREIPLDVIRRNLKDTVTPAPQLSAVVIVHRFWGHLTTSTRPLGEGDIATITDLFAPLQEEVLLIWNPGRLQTSVDDLIRRHLAPDIGAWVDI